jgi:hypothetical protein
MLEEIKTYIKQIRKRIQSLVPEEEIDPIMEDVSEVILKNWVDGGEYKLNKTQVMSLVRKHIAKKYRLN